MLGANVPSEDTLFTQRELELLLALKRFKSLKMAANELRISYRRAGAIKANIQRKWKLGVNSNNYMLSLMKRDEGFKKFMLTVGRSKLQIEAEEQDTF